MIPQSTDSGGVLVSELAGDADMIDLVELFVSELPQRVQALEAAIASNDVQQLARLAHQLKGAAGGYGFPAITEAARSLEQTVKSSADIRQLAAEVKAVVRLCGMARATPVRA